MSSDPTIADIAATDLPGGGRVPTARVESAARVRTLRRKLSRA
jgi:hypothetical protein